MASLMLQHAMTRYIEAFSAVVRANRTGCATRAQLRELDLAAAECKMTKEIIAELEAKDAKQGRA